MRTRLFACGAWGLRAPMHCVVPSAGLTLATFAIACLLLSDMGRAEKARLEALEKDRIKRMSIQVRYVRVTELSLFCSKCRFGGTCRIFRFASERTLPIHCTRLNARWFLWRCGVLQFVDKIYPHSQCGFTAVSWGEKGIMCCGERKIW